MPTYGPVPPAPTYGTPLPPSDLARRFGARTIAAIVLLIVSLVFVAIAGSSAQWSVTVPATFGTSAGTIYFNLGNVCFAGRCLPYTSPQIVSGAAAALTTVMGLANAFALVAMVMAFLALVFMVLAALWPRVGIASIACAVVGSLFILLVPIFLFFTLPGSFGGLPTQPGGSPVTSFFGSGSGASWGAGIGWYLDFVAFALFLVAAVLVVRARRSVALLGNIRARPTPAAPVGYAGSMPPSVSLQQPPAPYAQYPAYAAPAPGTPPAVAGTPPAPATGESWVLGLQAEIAGLERAMNEQRRAQVQLGQDLVAGRIDNPAYDAGMRELSYRLAESERQLAGRRAQMPPGRP